MSAPCPEEETMRLSRYLGACAVTLAGLLAASSASAQSHPEYVPLGRVQAALYKPDSGPAPHIAFLVAHRTANNLSTNACTELSKRGFMVLCFNTRFINNDHRQLGTDASRREGGDGFRPQAAGHHQSCAARPFRRLAADEPLPGDC
jgi:hypothetical protein